MPRHLLIQHNNWNSSLAIHLMSLMTNMRKAYLGCVRGGGAARLVRQAAAGAVRRVRAGAAGRCGGARQRGAARARRVRCGGACAVCGVRGSA